MARPTIHGANLSPFVRKVRVALAEKGIDYHLEPLNPFGVSDAYRKKSPLGKIPCYEEGDYTLPDSSAIIAFLERKQPEPSLYPSDPYEYGRALWYEEYADSKLAATCTVPFVQRFIRAKLMKQEPDEAAVARCLEKDLPPEYPYLMTIADNAKPEDLRLNLRGDPHSLGEPVPRGFPAVLAGSGDAPAPLTRGTGRAELAEAGITPVSQTDTEIAAQLLGLEVEKGAGLTEALALELAHERILGEAQVAHHLDEPRHHARAGAGPAPDA